MAKRLKLFGLTYLVGKIKVQTFISGFHSLSEYYRFIDAYNRWLVSNMFYVHPEPWGMIHFLNI